jgi:crotonobetainyl-CoA:carnitine CoA-transferase CaiB-like acyl-CoA transferase
MSNKIFEGINILDLSTVLAGPSVATFFAELGAHVVKIENPANGGDVTRSWKLQSEATASSVSAYFSAINYGKQYQTLDLKTEREALINHIKWAHVIVANFKNDDYQKFGLTPEQVFEMNEQVIYARISGFDSNPQRVAYDSVLQAETGFMYMNGTAQSGPVKMPVALIDVLAAHQMKEGILCAMIQQLKGAKKLVVNCSLEKAGLASLANQASNYLMQGKVAEPIGSLHPNIAPYGEAFATADNKLIVLAIGSDTQFKMLCKILGVELIANDARFATNQLRVKNRTQLAELLQKQFATQTCADWMQQFIEHNVPAGAIKNMAEVMQNKVAQQMILEEEIDGVMTKRLASVAFSITTY